MRLEGFFDPVLDAQIAGDFYRFAAADPQHPDLGFAKGLAITVRMISQTLACSISLVLEFPGFWAKMTQVTVDAA